MEKGGAMKKIIVVMVLWVGSMAVVENSAAGWMLPSQRTLKQLGAACDDYYDAATEEKKLLYLERASDALMRIKIEDRISEKKMIATLKKYKKIKPKSVAVVILALDTCKPNVLEAVQKTIASPSAVKWANEMVVLSSAK